MKSTFMVGSRVYSTEFSRFGSVIYDRCPGEYTVTFDKPVRTNPLMWTVACLEGTLKKTNKLSLDECFQAILDLARENGYVATVKLEVRNQG